MNFDEKIKELDESPYISILAIMGTVEPSVRLGAATYAALQVYKFARAAGLTWEQTEAILAKLLKELEDKHYERMLTEISTQPTTTN